MKYQRVSQSGCSCSVASLHYMTAVPCVKRSNLKWHQDTLGMGRASDVDHSCDHSVQSVTCCYGPVWARERCRINPPRFLAEYCKRQVNQGSFVLLYFRLFTFSDLNWVCLSVFSCTVLFVSISQVIGCEDRLRNDLYCFEWGVKLYSNQPTCCYARRNSCHSLGRAGFQTPLLTVFGKMGKIGCQSAM